MDVTEASKSTSKTSYVINTLLLFALGFVVFVAFLVNGFVLCVFKKKQSLLRSPTNRLLCSCASSDLLSGFVALCNLISSLSRALNSPGSSFAYSYRVFVDLLATFLQLSTLFHLCLLTLDRYVALFFSLRYKAIVNGRRAKNAIIVVWFLAFSVSFVQIFWLYRVLDGNLSIEDATVLDGVEWRYSIVTLSILVSVPILIVTVMYCRMYFQARKLLKNPATNQQPAIKRELYTMWIFFSIALSISLSSTPYFALRLYIDLQSVQGKPVNINDHIMHFVFIFKFVTHISNPLIYSVKKKDIRDAIQQYVSSSVPSCSWFKPSSLKTDTEQRNSKELGTGLLHLNNEMGLDKTYRQSENIQD